MADARRNDFEVYPAVDGWRWRMTAGENGEPMASGEAYADRRDCEKAVERIRFGVEQSTLKLPPPGTQLPKPETQAAD